MVGRVRFSATLSVFQIAYTYDGTWGRGTADPFRRISLPVYKPLSASVSSIPTFVVRIQGRHSIAGTVDKGFSTEIKSTRFLVLPRRDCCDHATREIEKKSPKAHIQRMCIRQYPLTCTRDRNNKRTQLQQHKQRLYRSCIERPQQQRHTTTSRYLLLYGSTMSKRESTPHALLQKHFLVQPKRAAHHVASCSEACVPAVPVPPLLSPSLPTTSQR